MGIQHNFGNEFRIWTGILYAVYIFALGKSDVFLTSRFAKDVELGEVKFNPEENHVLAST